MISYVITRYEMVGETRWQLLQTVADNLNMSMNYKYLIINKNSE